MKFDDASAVDQICYEMRLADYPRSLDRARINDLFNGVPPYTAEEAERNGIDFNVNFLEPTRLAHDARMQFAGNFLKPGTYFTATTDAGPPHKRTNWSTFATKKVGRIMKRSTEYYETFRSKVAMDVLHGIGPACWDKRDFWCPEAIGVEDVLVPANTYLTMKNLPFLSLYHSYTGPELMRLTRDRKRASAAGWNMKLVDRCLEYVDRETMALSHNNWPEVWSPEKMAERVKGDGGFYAADSAPTIDCFDFYYWNDDDDEEGWCRRIILDSWSTPASSGMSFSMQRDSKKDFGKGQFLFNSRNRKVASSWHEIGSFQFADLSAVAPFKYHSVRSMGYLLYAIGHLQNRLRCRFNEAVWEATLMYLRVRSLDDVQRAFKVTLANRGIVDESVQFIPAAERFQINTQLVELGLAENQKIILENSSSWTQSAGKYSNDRTEKTKFQVMAEIQTMTALISAGLQQAYHYQGAEYREIWRRFLLADSRDPDVKEFRGACLTAGIPEKYLVPQAWDIEPQRILGAGNRTLEMAIAEQLMAFRHLYDPEAQTQILRDFTMAVTEDPARAEAMVPESPSVVTDSIHDAELSTAALMLGIPVELKAGMNHIEYVNTMLRNLAVLIGKVNRSGAPTMNDILGFVKIAQHIAEHIQLVEQDKNEKARVTEWNKVLTKLMNQVKKFAQQTAKQDGGQQIDPKDLAKIKAIQIQAQAKAQNTRESHAQRTAQRQIQFEMEEKRKDMEAAAERARENAGKGADLEHESRLRRMDLQQSHAENLMDLSRRQVEHNIDIAAEVRRSRLKSTEQ